MEMNFSKYFQFFALLGLFLVSVASSAQKGYAEDSLQIKVYSEITFERYRATAVKITKIFCDYCSENQLKHIKEVAWDTAYNERHAPENIVKNGKKKLAIYLRLPKDKFRLLKDE